VLLRLGLEVLEVEVAVGLVLYGDDAHARHDGRGRVRAVGRSGDEADVALLLAIGVMVGPDDGQAGAVWQSEMCGLANRRGVRRTIRPVRPNWAAARRREDR
jgi:hypothetical protein